MIADNWNIFVWDVRHALEVDDDDIEVKPIHDHAADTDIDHDTDTDNDNDDENDHSGGGESKSAQSQSSMNRRSEMKTLEEKTFGVTEDDVLIESHGNCYILFIIHHSYFIPAMDSHKFSYHQTITCYLK